jgi:hypothetical protein
LGKFDKTVQGFSDFVSEARELHFIFADLPLPGIHKTAELHLDAYLVYRVFDFPAQFD